MCYTRLHGLHYGIYPLIWRENFPAKFSRKMFLPNLAQNFSLYLWGVIFLLASVGNFVAKSVEKIFPPYLAGKFHNATLAATCDITWHKTLPTRPHAHSWMAWQRTCVYMRRLYKWDPITLSHSTLKGQSLSVPKVFLNFFNVFFLLQFLILSCFSFFSFITHTAWATHVSAIGRHL